MREALVRAKLPLVSLRGGVYVYPLQGQDYDSFQLYGAAEVGGEGAVAPVGG